MNSRKWRNFFYDLEQKTEPKFDPNLSLISEDIFDDMDLTMLSESQIKLLMEGRKENFINKYSGKLDDQSIDDLLDFDEEYKYKHLNWMAKAVMKSTAGEDDLTQPEAIENVIGAVRDFVRYSQLMKKKDINQYAGVNDLLNAIQVDVIQRRIKKARKEREKGRRVSDQLFNTGQAGVIYEDDRFFVVRPATQEASCFFGSKTKWCIAQPGNSYFSQYTSQDGRIFYFIKDDSKTNEDFNYKYALEMGKEGDEIALYTIWDRYDDPVQVGSTDDSEWAYTLVNEFQVPEETAQQIAYAIYEHAYDNPPENPLGELEQRINNNHYDGGFLTIDAYLEDYSEYAYLSINPSVHIELPIENERMLQMLNNDELDIDEATESLIEALMPEGELLEKLESDVDIGASKYWMPEEEDRYEIDIKQGVSGENPEGWTFVIDIGGFQDVDYGGTYTDLREAEQFCEYMQEEWGERNEEEILESLQEHIYRFIPEIAQAGADQFRALKDEFANGTHELIEDKIYYTVDDDDDENSDLNLFMEFNFNLSKEFIEWIFGAETITNASGNLYTKRTRSHSDATETIRTMTRGSGNAKGYLERAIYNVYQKAAELASKQMKLDFGPEWDFDDEMVMPSVPQSINVQKSITTRMAHPALPTDAGFKIVYSIYIPFHKSPQELEAIMRFFSFMTQNYDEIETYLYKYIETYSAAMNGGMFSGNPRPDKILAENIYYDIMDAQMFLKSLKDQLRLLKK